MAMPPNIGFPLLVISLGIRKEIHSGEKPRLMKKSFENVFAVLKFWGHERYANVWEQKFYFFWKIFLMKNLAKNIFCPDFFGKL